MVMLHVTEIYHSIQGEGTRAGRLCLFVRLSGCSLRCTYCDTTYGFAKGKATTVDEILVKLKEFPTRLVQVTGGEPLEQKECPALLSALLKEGYEVLLESNGKEDISVVPEGVRIILDVKTPGSGMADHWFSPNLNRLGPQDELKFVITDNNDYVFAKDFIARNDLASGPTILMSPALPQKDISWLADKIISDALPVRFQPQMHKWIWGNRPSV